MCSLHLVVPKDSFSGYPVYDRHLLEPDVLRPAGDRRRVTLIGDAAHPMTPLGSWKRDMSYSPYHSRAVLRLDLGLYTGSVLRPY